MLRSLQAFILVTLATSTGLLAGATVTDKAFGKGLSQNADFSLLTSVMTTIRDSWAGDTESSTLVYGAASGMVASLDKHSAFFDPEAYKKVREDTDGLYYGIGIEVRLANTGAKVTRVMPASPAESAGLQLEDIITEANGTPLQGISLDEITSLIRGPRGTSVTLTVRRKSEHLKIEVVRDQVRVPAVTAALFEPGIGYARIDEFQRRTATELRSSILMLEDEGNTPLHGLVLDLRGNPGGLVEEAIAVTDMFLMEGTILEVRGKDESLSERHEASKSNSDLDFPLVIMVNGTSASASEIVAGSLQAHGRAILIGSTTYGKGSVQKLYEFPDGSALKLTTARYYLPDGRAIEQNQGLLPDHVIKLPTRLPQSWLKLREAINGLTLDPTDRDSVISKLDTVEKRHIKARSVPIVDEDDISDRLNDDAQLKFAFEKVNGLP